MKGGRDGRMGELDWMGLGVMGGGIVIGLMALDKRNPMFVDSAINFTNVSIRFTQLVLNDKRP